MINGRKPYGLCVRIRNYILLKHEPEIMKEEMEEKEGAWKLLFFLSHSPHSLMPPFT